MGAMVVMAKVRIACWKGHGHKNTFGFLSFPCHGRLVTSRSTVRISQYGVFDVLLFLVTGASSSTKSKGIPLPQI